MRAPILVGELELTEPIDDVHCGRATRVSRTTVFAAGPLRRLPSDICRWLPMPSTPLLLRERSGSSCRASSTLSANDIN